MDTPVPSARLRAFERAYTEHGPVVRATLRARGVPSSAIDDVLHDVFVTAYGRIDRRDPSVKLSHWLIGLAYNAAFSHRRSAARRRRRHDALPVDRATPPVSADELDARRSWEVVTEFLAELPARQREALMLCEVAGFPASELAIVWGSTVNTVHSRLRLARARFSRRFPAARGVGDFDALLAAARREITPPPARTRRSWAALATELARRSWISIPSAGVAGVVLMLGTGAVGVALALPPEPSEAATELPKIVAFEEHASAPPIQTSDALDGSPLAIGGSNAPVLTPSQTSPRRTSAGSAARSPRDFGSSTPASLPSSRSTMADAPSGSEQADPSRSNVHRETALLSRARARLRSGAPGDALRLLQQHERDFPDGLLTIERHRLRVDALCRLERVDEARAVAGELDAAAPDRVGGRTPESPCHD